MAAADQQSAGEIGYKRPPKSTQFKPGQRANPKGRPRGSPNKKTQVENALDQKISVRKGNKIRKMPAWQAVVEVFLMKAAQGDRHAANVVMNIASKTGALTTRDDQPSNVPSVQSGKARELLPSERLLDGIDSALLSKQEQIDLSKLVQRIDLAGDVTTLGDEDFALLKQIVNKGRGKQVSDGNGNKEAA